MNDHDLKILNFFKENHVDEWLSLKEISNDNKDISAEEIKNILEKLANENFLEEKRYIVTGPRVIGEEFDVSKNTTHYRYNSSSPPQR